jgi:uncharacterized protein YyaL (SSP411 family)
MNNGPRANRLINETSPYLLQHAHNPVDWYPWGSEALDRARREDKPVLLSIGYSTCHWCHVMEKESFENTAIAALMNKHFVCIKVDREEHPDVDHLYMGAVQAMTGGGGWPLTVFLTPQGEPFHGGTYFPPEDRHGIPGFPRVLLAISEAYNNRLAQVTDTAKEVTAHLKERATLMAQPQLLSPDILNNAYGNLVPSFDRSNGGFGSAPKFPQPMTHEFLLRQHLRGERPALEMVLATLDRMAAGGIRDHIGGGFHRYATDARWTVPHFEKMLYDNALLSQLYLHAYQVTGNPLYRSVSEETLDYVIREMTDPAGGFYSAQDADTEGGEGQYYLWSADEIVALLGEEHGGLMNRYFGVSAGGNFEGKNILHMPSDAGSFGSGHGMGTAEVEGLIERSKKILLASRERRTRPHRDEKIVASWNGMMLRSFAEAACILGRDDYREIAVANGSFLLRELRQGDLLMHSYKDGTTKIPGYLDDYGLLVSGLLALHEATFEQLWLVEAVALADFMIHRFSDKESQGVFYDSGQGHSELLIRSRDTVDSVKPCGGSAAAEVLLRIAAITGEGKYEDSSVAMLSLVSDQMVTHPLGSGHWLCALDYFLAQPTEVAIVGGLSRPETRALVGAVCQQYLPSRILVGAEPDRDLSAPATPLLRDRHMIDGQPTAYLCQGRSCYSPITDPDKLKQGLAKGVSPA